ncbi:MAG: hypothetical protein IJK14_01505 [Clostridia bacterium]|nr:hypothetical protein [Clostridia bacterium]MBR0444040.1 hypothetical protein [Clostridia bacterium]
MRYPEGKEEYHDIYPEFNSEHEGTIKHKERSAARSAVSSVLAAAVVLSSLAAILNLSGLKPAVIRPKLVSVTEHSAQVDVSSRLNDSGITYPIHYQLFRYSGEESPVTSSGRLRLSDRDLSGHDTPVLLTGEILEPDTTLVFEDLESDRPYLLVFRTDDSENDGVLRKEALLIATQRPLKRPQVPAGLITPEPPPVTPAPPITPPPTISVPPVTPVAEPGPTEEQPPPGPTKDNPMYYPGEVIIEPPKKPKISARPGKTPAGSSPYVTP